MIYKIEKLTQINESKYYVQIVEIFYATSSVQFFANDEAKKKFLDKWLTPYFEKIGNTLIVIARDGDKCIGYLSGCLDTKIFRQKCDSPSLSLFAEKHILYPAHFHVNVHPDYQGRGVGKDLVLEFISLLKASEIRGVHLVTSPEALNVSFYTKIGFTHRAEVEFTGQRLLFLGMQLD